MKMTVQKKIFFLISSLVMVIVIFFSVYSIRNMRRHMRTGFMEKGRILVSHLARNIQSGVLIEDSELLNEALNFLFEEDDVRYAAIYNSDNAVLADKTTIEDYTPAVAAEARVETLEINELFVNESLPLFDFRYPVIFAEDGEYLGYINVGISLESINREIARAERNALYFMLACIGLGSICSFVIAKSITRRTIAVVETLNELSKGNLNVKLTRHSRDELGEMTTVFNAFIEQLRRIQLQIQETVHSVNSIADVILQEMHLLTTQMEQQSTSIDQAVDSVQGIDHFIHVIGSDTSNIHAAAEQNLSALQQMRTSVREVSMRAGDLAASLDQISSSVEQINHSVQDVSQNAGNLGQIVRQTEAEIHRIDQAMKALAQNADNSRLLAEETKEAAQKGQLSVESSIQGISDLKDVVSNTTQVIQEINTWGEQVHSILDIVDDIAEQTSLLSLNASIISAQAGEHGRGFGVVASEIKELATRTKNSTKEISALINVLQQKTADGVKGITTGLQKADQGVRLVSAVKESLNAILESATRSSIMAADTARVTQQTAASSQIIETSINTVTQQVLQIGEAIQQQEQDISRVVAGTIRIHDMSEYVKRASSEQENASQQITHSVELTTEKFNDISVQTTKLQHNSQQIVTAMHTIESVTENILQETRKISGVAVQQLVKQAEVLQQLIKVFKVS